MPIPYPIRFAAQLRQHLKAFRKARNLTQAQLGNLVGVSQGRIAEIEANPGLVKFEQLMQILSAMDVTLSMTENSSMSQTPKFEQRASEVFVREPAEAYDASREVPQKSTRSGDEGPVPSGQQRKTQSNQTDAPAAPVALRTIKTEHDDQQISRRNFVVQPKKGSW